MCWRYLSLHACGHLEPTLFDTNLNVQGRCDTVNAALMWYHDQPLYFPLQESLPLPWNCPPIVPQYNDTEQHVAAIYENQQDWNDRLIHTFESCGFGFEDRANLTLKAQYGKLPEPAQPTKVYPETRGGVYVELLKYQHDPMKAPNVTVTGEVPWICQWCRKVASENGIPVPPTSVFRCPPRFPLSAHAPLSRMAPQPPPRPYQRLIEAQVQGRYDTVREYPEIRVTGQPRMEESMDTLHRPSNHAARSSSLPPATLTPSSRVMQETLHGEMVRPASSWASTQTNVPAVRTPERALTPQVGESIASLEEEREEDEKHREQEAELFDVQM